VPPPASGLRSPASGLRPPVSGLRSPASGLRPQVSRLKPQVSPRGRAFRKMARRNRPGLRTFRAPGCRGIGRGQGRRRQAARASLQPQEPDGQERCDFVQAFVGGHMGRVIAVHGRSQTCLRRCFGRQGSRPQLSALRIPLRSKAGAPPSTAPPVRRDDRPPDGHLVPPHPPLCGQCVVRRWILGDAAR